MSKVVHSIDISLRQNSCDKLKKRKAIRSYTPTVDTASRPSITVEPVNTNEKAAYSYNKSTRKVTAPLIGEFYLSNGQFSLSTPKHIQIPKSLHERYVTANIKPLENARSFILESKYIFKKKRNYVNCLKKSISELKKLCCFKEDYGKIVKIVHSKAYQDENSRIFLSACKSGAVKIVKSLIAKDPYVVHSYDNTRMTGLHWCAIRGYIKIAGILLNNNALINSLDIAHRTPLFLALKTENFEIIRFLLINRADPYISSNSKKKVIDLAKSSAIIELIKKAYLFHNMVKHLPENLVDEKWKTEVIPALMRVDPTRKNNFS